MLQHYSSSDDEEEEEEATEILCIFCDSTTTSVQEIITHIDKTHHIDIIASLGPLSFYNIIKVINFVRSTKCSEADFVKHVDVSKATDLSDQYLQPVLEDDPFLMIDFQEMHSNFKHLENGAHGKDKTPAVLQDDLSDKIELLETKLGEMHRAYSNLLERVPTNNVCDPYFDSYANYTIHAEMLQDNSRTDAYRDFVYQNKQLFAGKSVLDVGCGTGILSLFSAMAGATSVTAVDNSEIAKKARSIVKKNLLEGIITVVQGKIEDIDLNQKFDVLISEWMGYALLFECMLDSVIVARDKFLKPGGIMVPNKASMYLSAVSNIDAYNNKIGFWKNVYDFDMSDMIPDILNEASVESVDPNDVISSSCGFKHFDLSCVTMPDLIFDGQYSLHINKTSLMTGIVIYFTCFFDGPVSVVLDTSPNSPPTHWTQTVLYLATPLVVEADDIVCGTIRFVKSTVSKRGYSITIRGVIERGDSVVEEFKQEFCLA